MEKGIAMRKRSCVLFVVVLLGISSASVAQEPLLEPVTLEPDCPYVLEFDAQFAGLIALLGPAGLGVEELPIAALWQATDMETVDMAFMVGDGIDDYYQLGLLAAVLCEASAKATAADVLGQFEANLVLFNGLLDDLSALFAAVTDLKAEMEALALALTGIPGLEDLVAGLGVAAGTLGGFLAEYGDVPMLLGLFDDTFAGLAGLSSELALSLELLLGDLLEPIGDAVPDLEFLSANLVIAAGMLPDPLDAMCLALADNINAAIVMMLALAPPDFEIYGVTAKTDEEPFSAFCDYNDNDDTNLQVFDSVVGDNTPLLRPQFVAAASGADPWYAGNPGLPVAGIAALVLLVGAVTAGGVLAARKK